VARSPAQGELVRVPRCHIGGDFLLIYDLDDAIGKSGTIVFVRTGTHADLFNE
jgi:mRNA interferase YafQ